MSVNIQEEQNIKDLISAIIHECSDGTSEGDWANHFNYCLQQLNSGNMTSTQVEESLGIKI